MSAPSKEALEKARKLLSGWPRSAHERDIAAALQQLMDELGKVRTQGMRHCFLADRERSVCGGVLRTNGRWEVRDERPRCMLCVSMLRELPLEPGAAS